MLSCDFYSLSCVRSDLFSLHQKSGILLYTEKYIVTIKIVLNC